MTSRDIGEDNSSDLLRELVEQSKSAQELIGMGNPREDGLVGLDGYDERSESSSSEIERSNLAGPRR